MEFLGYSITQDGRVFNKHGREMKQFDNGKGYLLVNLRHNGKSFSKAVHRIVAEVYLPTIEGKREVNHLDGDKQNNSVDNLEWCNRSENLLHCYKIGGRSAKGVLNSNSSLSIEDVIVICELLAEGLSCKVVSEELGVSYHAVRHIRSGRTWSDISKDYL